jgi:5'-methylthioadenosine phosphorylase
MSATLACIVGEEIVRQWNAGRLGGQSLGPRPTPFGPSGPIYRVGEGARGYYLLQRYAGARKTAPHRVNYRANIYALKDLGANCVLAWGAGAAVTHATAVGDLVLADDVIDLSRNRPATFYDDSPLGYLRQFPVFCPHLRQLTEGVLAELHLPHQPAGTLAVTEGPRLETPAEVRMLSGMGAALVSHTFAPEMFLARELELCYAAVCYIVNYAETGSRHRPLAVGELFGGLAMPNESTRLERATGALGQVAAKLAAGLAGAQGGCECGQSMEYHRKQFGLGDDWRTWFKA